MKIFTNFLSFTLLFFQMLFTHLMNIEQYLLLQYIIKNRLLVRKANVFYIIDSFLIDLHHVCHHRSCERNDELLILFKGLGLFPYMVIGALGGVGTYDF